MTGRGDFTFTVTVKGMDLDAWAIDYGIDGGPDKIRADFESFARNNLAGALDELLHRMGYHDQSVDVR
ncbi:hypothetical protein SEA_IPHANE7_135 [Mycobacterium phage IPhane7]|uniref:Uncharacterized protein n=2 Tax=Bongovirus bongo TaxID=1983750 RepID=A0A385D4W6_9CAUD|nr:hypothetical protein SEA_IPHANE7_135 [Mycobacterium phage IPhane7]QGJ93260.1 hypothetical protein SEA_TYDAWG_132 [Mycobacterium phage TyDawg]WNM75329.1 hypothetical protein SEA_AUSPICE_138 [Mycobacterium phage Auspice]